MRFLKSNMSERNRTKINFYTDPQDHLKDELAKLDLMLHITVLHFQQSLKGNEKNALHGLYIADEEIDRIVNNQEESGETPEISKAIEQLMSLQQTIAQKVEEGVKQGIYLPLLHLTRVFQLSLFEMDVLLICLAPEIDNKYGKLYAYLHDDVTRKSPSPSLIMDLLCDSQAERMEARSCFLGQGHLFKYGLLEYVQDHTDGMSKPLISRQLKLTDRIVNFLLELNVMDADLNSFASQIYPRKTGEDIIMDENLKEGFLQLSETVTAEGEEWQNRFIFYLQGAEGAGKKSLAEAFCHRMELPLLVIKCSQLMKRGRDFESEVQRLCRETLLNPAAIYFDGFDNLAEKGENKTSDFYQQVIIETIKDFCFICFLSGQEKWHAPESIKDFFFMTLKVPRPGYKDRKLLWQQALNGHIKLSPQLDINAIAGKFQFTGGQIGDAIKDVQKQVKMRSGSFGEISEKDLYKSCRTQCNDKLSELARKITPVYSWKDIVLPEDKVTQLKEIRGHVKYRQKVYGDWGFGAKLSRGKGLNVLFSGPSGTGKTMSAEIIAGDLGLDIYRIDLSAVVSKYIGETEKNLERIFTEAETGNGILFFDEADALFGKRSEVKDAHDRYANIEINYLLQKMEEYEGTIILATNMSRNMDDAFTRRIHFTVDFPFPDEVYRLGIWQKIFPDLTPRQKGIDYEFLATRFKISGGNIKNVAVNASFLAAENSGKVSMEHLIRAVKREYQKMGRICSESDFGKYYGLVRGRVNHV
jgi:SpoVK/Ycf46/Vps4 family AAA+-type ATPase